MITNQEKEIATRIKELRKKFCETQKELAEAIGLNQDSISKIEQGTMNVTLKNLLAIAKHYHVSCDYICTGNDANTILTLLNTYVKLQYTEVISGDEHYTYPKMEIAKIFYDYLFQLANANANELLPKILKEQWMELAENNFFNKMDNEPQEYMPVIPLPENLIFPDDSKNEWKQTDLLREMEHQIKSTLSELE